METFLMPLDIAKEIAALERMSVGQLQDCYVDVFGEAVRSRHRTYLARRIAWRLQAQAEGGLSERALKRAEELVNDADVRVTPPKGEALVELMPPANVVRIPVSSDPRLPPPGIAISRKYKGQTLRVVVTGDGFEYLGERYKSLSAIAKQVTGTHINGFRFFRLGGKP